MQKVEPIGFAHFVAMKRRRLSSHGRRVNSKRQKPAKSARTDSAAADEKKCDGEKDDEQKRGEQKGGGGQKVFNKSGLTRTDTVQDVRDYMAHCTPLRCLPAEVCYIIVEFAKLAMEEGVAKRDGLMEQIGCDFDLQTRLDHPWRHKTTNINVQVWTLERIHSMLSKYELQELKSHRKKDFMNKVGFLRSKVVLGRRPAEAHQYGKFYVSQFGLHLYPMSLGELRSCCRSDINISRQEFQMLKNAAQENEAKYNNALAALWRLIGCLGVFRNRRLVSPTNITPWILQKLESWNTEIVLPSFDNQPFRGPNFFINFTDSQDDTVVCQGATFISVGSKASFAHVWNYLRDNLSLVHAEMTFHTWQRRLLQAYCSTAERVCSQLSFHEGMFDDRNSSCKLAESIAFIDALILNADKFNTMLQWDKAFSLFVVASDQRDRHPVNGVRLSRTAGQRVYVSADLSFDKFLQLIIHDSNLPAFAAPIAPPDRQNQTTTGPLQVDRSRIEHLLALKPPQP